MGYDQLLRAAGLTAAGCTVMDLPSAYNEGIRSLYDNTSES